MTYHHDIHRPEISPHLSTGDAQPDAPPINMRFPLHTMSLTSPIRVRFFDRGRRGLTLPTHLLHHDTWNAILCEGVPVSLLELVQLVVDHLGLAVNMSNSHRMLECDWKLGWRISTTTNTGMTRHIRGVDLLPAQPQATYAGTGLRQTSRTQTVVS